MIEMATSYKPSTTKKRISTKEALSADRIRRDLALIATILLVVLAMVAAIQSGAMPVLEKLLPLVAMIFGFFFARKGGGI
jgi:hypothetical protein